MFYYRISHICNRIAMDAEFMSVVTIYKEYLKEIPVLFRGMALKDVRREMERRGHCVIDDPFAKETMFSVYKRE